MKILRVKKKKDFSKVLRAGKRAHAESLTIVWIPSDRTKFAVCVGKKYGKSVVRNRIKRLLREAFRAHAHALGTPCLILLIPRAAKSYSYAAFERDMGKIFRKEKLVEDRACEPVERKRAVPQKNGCIGPF